MQFLENLDDPTPEPDSAPVADQTPPLPTEGGTRSRGRHSQKDFFGNRHMRYMSVHAANIAMDGR